MLNNPSERILQDDDMSMQQYAFKGGPLNYMHDGKITDDAEAEKYVKFNE